MKVVVTRKEIIVEEDIQVVYQNENGELVLRRESTGEIMCFPISDYQIESITEE